MVLTVFAGMAEFERALIHQRTSSGRVAARTRGVRFGRPPKLTPEQIALGRRLVDEGISISVVIVRGPQVDPLFSRQQPWIGRHSPRVARIHDPRKSDPHRQAFRRGLGCARSKLLWL